MNREEVEKFYETIEYEIHKISSNEAYINNSSYFGLNRELLSYIRKLENALDEIEKYITQQQDEQSEQAGFNNAFTEYITINVDDLLQIIKKAKGE